MNTLFSVYVWLVWVLHLLLWGPLALVAVAISPRGLGFRVTQAGARSAFFFAGIRVQVVGLEHVDWSRPLVFMGNHQNLLDPFAMLIAVPRHMAGVEKIENLKIPVYGALSRAWGNIPIQRANPGSSHAGIALASERLRAGEAIAIMPEGTRSKDGTIGPFKKGGFHMALDAGADIQTFTINGAFQRLHNGDWHVHPGAIEIVFGDLVPTADYTKETIDELVTRVRAAVEANYKGLGV